MLFNLLLQIIPFLFKQEEYVCKTGLVPKNLKLAQFPKSFPENKKNILSF